jgi:hypothetical protein
MSEPPAQHHLSGGEWRPLADQIAANVKNFVDGVEALARGGGDETVPLLLLEVSQILLAGAQLGASRDVVPRGNWEPEVGDDPDLDALRVGLATRLSAVDEYAEVFDPYADTSCLPFRISDDIAAVTADLIHGLRHYQAGRSLEALWWWQYSYFNHWGTHGGAALRALHAVVAHASLDVAEESTLLAGGTPPLPPRSWGDPSPQTPLGGDKSPQIPLGGTHPPRPTWHKLKRPSTTRGGAARPWRSWCRNMVVRRSLTRMASSGSRSGSWPLARPVTRSWWSCPRWVTQPMSSWTWPAR